MKDDQFCIFEYVWHNIFFFAVGFDAMGLTDNENPIGLMPFLNPGFGIIGKRKRRNTAQQADPEIKPHTIAGGERFEYKIEQYFERNKRFALKLKQ